MFNNKLLKRQGFVFLFISGLLLAPMSAIADSKISINNRFQKQKIKITQGIKLKQLTTQEKKSLEQEQSEIKAYQKLLKNDGSLSKQDKQKIHNKLDKANLHIYNLRFNNKRAKK